MGPHSAQVRLSASVSGSGCFKEPAVREPPRSAEPGRQPTYLAASRSDEARRRVRLRKQTTKTRRALWIELPPVLADALEATLAAARGPRPGGAPFAGSGADALRTAIAKACKAAAIPLWSPHDLRHRRMSLLHLGGCRGRGSASGSASEALGDGRHLHARAQRRDRARLRGAARVTALEGECRECGRRTTRATLKGLCYDCSVDCPHAQVVIGRVRLASGAVQVKSRCLRCGNMLGNRPNDEFVLDNLPWLYDRTSEIACARCGEISGVELHHWAPRARFGDDADRWPTGFLCRRCHASGTNAWAYDDRPVEPQALLKRPKSAGRARAYPGATPARKTG